MEYMGGPKKVVERIRAPRKAAVIPFDSSGSIPQTQYLKLNVPPTGMTQWGPDLNFNFYTLDSAVGALQHSYQGEWLDSKVYALGQIVTWQGGVYMSLSDGNVNQQPDLQPDMWGPLGASTSIPFPPPGIAVSSGSAWAASINPASIPGYPGAGIAVSTGSAWGTPIDPSAVATYPGAGIAVSTGLGWAAPIDPATLAYVNKANNFAGNQTITGNATVTSSINVGGGSSPTLALSVATSSGPQGVFASLSAVTNLVGGYKFDGYSSDFSKTITWLTMYEDSAGQFVNFPSNTVHSGKGFHTGGSGDVLPGSTVDYLTNNARFISVSATGSATHPDMSLISLSGDSSFYSEWLRYRGATNLSEFATDVQVDGKLTVTDSASKITLIASGGLAIQQWYSAASPVDAKSWQAFATPSGQWILSITNDVNNAATNVMIINRNGTVPTSTNFLAAPLNAYGNLNVTLADATASHMSFGTFDGNQPVVRWICGNATPDNRLWEIYSDGSPVLLSRTLSDSGQSGSNYMAVYRSGASATQVYVPVQLAGPNKTFQIPHPLDPENRWLVHGCLEGPEHGAYYRGEAVTGEDGSVRIELPDYFEALTRPEGRTVQVTQIGNSDDEFVMLMAGRIEQGSFKVRSSTPNVAFYWQVNAIRSDLPPLWVERPVLNDEKVVHRQVLEQQRKDKAGEAAPQEIG